MILKLKVYNYNGDINWSGGEAVFKIISLSFLQCEMGPACLL